MPASSAFKSVSIVRIIGHFFDGSMVLPLSFELQTINYKDNYTKRIKYKHFGISHFPRLDMLLTLTFLEHFFS